MPHSALALLTLVAASTSALAPASAQSLCRPNPSTRPHRPGHLHLRHPEGLRKAPHLRHPLHGHLSRMGPRHRTGDRQRHLLHPR